MTRDGEARGATRGGGRTLTLDGLRGIAVLAVVVEHAWPSVLPGGFAGVDVFFVLSGYLITRILVVELAATGRIDLWAFYARRVRRILPASLVTVAGTCLLFAVLLGAAVPSSMRDQALAATFSVSNILFAQQAVDYFAADLTSSPFLHFWSLAVEEQFYLVWPSLLVLLVIVTRRLTGPVRAWAPIGIVALLGVASLALAILAPQSQAFFLLPHRGWELIVGGLFAWLQQRGHMTLPDSVRPYRWVGVVAGFALIAVTFAAAPELGAWPGIATVLPVAGTALLVAGGDDMPGARVLTVRPLQFFGRISYALYLWHWPILAAAALIALPAPTPPVLVSLAGIGVAILAATASTILMEEPVRSSRVPALVGRRAVATGLAGMLVVGVGSVALTSTVPGVMAALDPFSAAVATARTDRERIIEDGCITTSRSAKVRECVYGTAALPDGSPLRTASPEGPVAVLFGDSHAMHWFPAIDAWARDRGLALVPLVRSGCPPVDAPVVAEARLSRMCDTWRSDALDRIEALDPVITIASGSTGVPVLVDGAAAYPRVNGVQSGWVEPAARMLEALDARGGAVVLLGDVPRPGFPVPDCLAVHRGRPADCSLPVGEATPPVLIDAEAAAAALAGVDLIDPTPWLCAGDTCDWMAGDDVGWVDDHHISASNALRVLPELAPLLNRAAGLDGADTGATP